MGELRAERMFVLAGECCGRADRRLRSDRLVTEPFPPCPHGAADADPLDEPLRGEIVGDALSRKLQPEERVDALEVSAVGGRARCVHPADAALRAADLERRRDIEA